MHAASFFFRMMGSRNVIYSMDCMHEMMPSLINVAVTTHAYRTDHSEIKGAYIL